MTPRSRWLILGFALLGLGFASASSWVHYKLLTDASYVSVCDINETFNCSQVYLSPYGSVWGVPVALGGVIFFALVALIAGAAKPGTGERHPAAAYIFALSIVGFATILYLGYASLVVLKTGCVLCIGTYVAVFGIFLVSGFSDSVSMFKLPSRLVKDLQRATASPAMFVAAVLFVAGAASAVAFFPKEGTRPVADQQAPTAQAAQDFASAWAQQPRQQLGIPADGAKVVVVKFNDYQCPGCARTHEWYKPVLEKFQKSHPGAVKYVVKDWPWHSSCNFNTGATMHAGACEAAAAVRMARDRGPAKVDEMETWLYANQPMMSPLTVREAAQKILGVADFDKEYAAKLPDIKRDIADGGALAIKSTPTLFINGVRIEALMPGPYFEMAIELELKKAGGN